MLLNDLQMSIMVHLTTYTYLNNSHITILTGRSLSYVRSQLAILVQRQFVKSFQVVVSAKREPNLYYLTKQGLECLQDNEKGLSDTVKIPLQSAVGTIGDYQHRKRLIDIQVAANLFFEQRNIEVCLLQRYFDKTGNNRRDNNLESVTKISLGNGQSYAPDAIIITQFQGKRKIYIHEFFNDKSSNRIMNSLAKNARNISIASASEKYNVQADAIVLSAFTYPGIMQAVIKRLQANPKFVPIKDLFFFATHEQITKDFSAWKTIDDIPIQFTD